MNIHNRQELPLINYMLHGNIQYFTLLIKKQSSEQHRLTSCACIRHVTN